MGKKNLYFTLKVDCEATGHSVNNRELGEGAVRGLIEICQKENLKLTFYIIPSDLESSPDLYKEALNENHEIGLHVHPADQGYKEFLGIYGPEEQKKIIGEAKDRFAQILGFDPVSFCAGYGSANDYTYAVLEELGFTHGMISIPTRVLPECASVWAGAPLDIHYANRWNRVLPGDMDFVELPNTLDPDSRMWGGKHPQDLRVELVDAKNHWYTIHKSIIRQLNTQETKLKRIQASTHNTFAYHKKDNFRRITLEKIIRSVRNICINQGLELKPATDAKVAEEYRKLFPRKKLSDFKLDTRGRI